MNVLDNDLDILKKRLEEREELLRGFKLAEKTARNGIVESDRICNELILKINTIISTIQLKNSNIGKIASSYGKKLSSNIFIQRSSGNIIKFDSIEYVNHIKNSRMFVWECTVEISYVEIKPGKIDNKKLQMRLYMNHERGIYKTLKLNLCYRFGKLDCISKHKSREVISKLVGV